MAEAIRKSGWIKRFDLRGKLPVVYGAIALGLIVLAVLDNAYWGEYTPRPRESIPYFLLFFHHTISKYLFVLICPLSLLSFLGLVFFSEERQWGLAILMLFANLCLFLFGFVGYYVEGIRLEPLDGLTFGGHDYHLIYYHTWGDGGDHFSMSFVVYQCDEANLMCSPVNILNDTANGAVGRPRQGHFAIDHTDSILYVELTDGRITERHRIVGIAQV
jgi:hypothetical protein